MWFTRTRNLKMIRRGTTGSRLVIEFCVGNCLISLASNYSDSIGQAQNANASSPGAQGIRYWEPQECSGNIREYTYQDP